MLLEKIVTRLLGLKPKSTQDAEPDLLFDLKGDYTEHLRSRQFLQQKSGDLDKHFTELVTAMEGEFGGWALAESALRYLFYYIMQTKIPERPYHILELGGGQSTMFWKGLSSKVCEIAVTTWEHDPTFAERLAAQTMGTSINVSQRRLVQYSDTHWGTIFAAKTLEELDRALQSASPKIIDKSEYSNWRINNVFYEFDAVHRENFMIDALIVDGPHGNGRSMAYAVFARNMKAGTLILIDDVSHYPFLEHLSKFMQFTILQTSFSLTKQWVLLRVDSVLVP